MMTETFILAEKSVVIIRVERRTRFFIGSNPSALRATKTPVYNRTINSGKNSIRAFPS